MAIASLSMQVNETLNVNAVVAQLGLPNGLAS